MVRRWRSKCLILVLVISALGCGKLDEVIKNTSTAPSATATPSPTPTAVPTPPPKVYLVVTDRGNNRVLIWHPFPTSTNEAATYVLGQSLFTTNTANNGGPNENSLKNPSDFIWTGTKFILTDWGNHRVLFWNSLPLSNATAANLQLGQPDFATVTVNTGGIGANSLNVPNTPVSDGQRFYQSDSTNNRILIWNSLPTTNRQAADWVLGQPDFISNTINNGGISNSSLYSPTGLIISENKLYATDTLNHRILIWNLPITANNQAANAVLGQSDFVTVTANTGGISASTVNQPNRMVVCNGKFVLSDRTNQRILIWNSIPTTNTPANLVLAQPDFVSSTANNGGVSAQGISGSNGVSCYGNKLIVSDSGNHRVLIWNSFPTVDRQAADIVLGQPDFATNSGGTTSQKFTTPIAAKVIEIFEP